MNAFPDPAEDPLLALKRGDPKPFETFVHENARRLVGFFRRRGIGIEEAEDLTQDVLLKLHRSADGYVPRERFHAYVARVAHNRLIDARRRKGARIQAFSLDQTEDDEPGFDVAQEGGDPLAPLELAEARDQVEMAVAKLSEAHQAVFQLAVVDELSYQEISQILEIPVGTVKSRVFHAIRQLRERLGGEEEVA